MKRIPKKIVTITLIGNALEFYDLGLFGFLAPVIIPLYFPQQSVIASLLASMLVFAVGFVARPVGAAIFGYVGDRIGRTISLNVTIIFMAIPTLGIALLPTYDQIGLTAPILLVLFRFLQGICTGGEYNNAAIFILENSPKEKRGFYSGIVTASSIFGFLLASVVVSIISMFPALGEAGWRLPFVFGASIGIVGGYMRTVNVHETSRKQKTSKTTFMLFQQHWNGFIIAIGIGWCAGTLSLSLLGYMTSYLTMVVKISIQDTVFVNTAGLIVYIVCLPLMGKLSDYIGVRYSMIISSILTILLSYPFFYLLNQKEFFSLVAGEVGLAILASSFLGPMHAYMLSLFPPEFRCRGISLAFSLGVGLFGGTAPIISTLMIEFFTTSLAPAFYYMLSAFIALSLIIFATRKSMAPKNLFLHSQHSNTLSSV
jgi:MHS family proline/betaine transporter-like MFS transporter